MIVVGVDAHSQTHTAAALKAQTAVELDVLSVVARAAGHEQLLAWAQALDGERVWALEDCRTFSGGLERHLLAASEQVLRVPPKLVAQTRKSARTYGKSDPVDAVAVARAAIREPNLPVAQLPGPEREIRLLADHREHVVAESSRHQVRLRTHLHDIDPELEPPLRCLGQRAVLDSLDRKLARRRPDPQTQITRELIRRIRELVRRARELRTQLERLVRGLCPSLLELPGCGPLTAARILGEIGNVTRCRSDAHLSSFGGTSPLDASSGKQRRHRLNRTGNRRLNRALHIIAITQARIHVPARAYIARRVGEGKTNREAIRALKRYITRRIYRILATGIITQPVTGAAPLKCI